MPYDLKYGHVHVDGNGVSVSSTEDEKLISERFESKKIPCFVLMATDPIALRALQHYRTETIAANRPSETIEGVTEAVEAFQDYQAVNADLVKYAD